jgi:hypothetical protein
MDRDNRQNTAPHRTIGILLILAGVAAMVIGVISGEVQTVLQKATLICLECIGLG